MTGGFLNYVIDGPYADAKLPDGPRDPSLYNNKRSYVHLVYDEVGSIEGDAGWSGHMDHNSANERLIRFAAP